ncbi:MAG: glycosyl hydrolase family 8 [Myxococcota bacterium]
MLAFLVASAIAATTAPGAASLRADWDRYVRVFVQDDGRVIDRGRDDLSTSEGQAYAMVRAVWCDDRPTFDRVLRWTLDNLQAGDAAKLPGWKWGKRPDGAWGPLDANSAADADQWMAWALLAAADKWKDPSYRERGKALLPALWEKETMRIGKRRVLLPGEWARTHDPVQVNPSYWLPFAWRRFAKEDPDRDWAGMVDDAYALLETCRSPSGLPPDWCWLDRKTGRATAPPEGQQGSLAFGFEAFRVGWTLAAEARWYGDVRARAQLAPYGDLADRWAAGTPVPAIIEPDGKPRETWDYLGLYGALLPAWAEIRPSLVDQLYADEVRPAREAAQDPAVARDYYAHNWIWLGLALWSGLATP